MLTVRPSCGKAAHVAVNKRLDEWVHEDRVDLQTVQAPKKEEKKLQGAAAHKVGEPGPRKHPGGRKRKQSEFGAAADTSSQAPSETATEMVSSFLGPC